MEEQTPQEPVKELNIVEEAKKIRDEIKAENDRREEILKNEQNLRAENMLAGTSGGHVEAPQISEEEQKVNGAIDFFKGSELENAIRKANEKK